MKDICNITAVILAGGLGTRLRSVVSDRPKVMAEISGKPFLAYLLDQVLAAGVKETVLCSGYMAEKIEQFFGNSYKSMHLSYSVETEPLGTGGAIRLALPFIKTDTVLVMNGDSYLNVNISEYIEPFLGQTSPAALFLTKMENASRYGSVKIKKDKTVAFFEEKSDNAEPGWINAGIYLLKRSLITEIPEGKFYSLERELFPYLAGTKLHGFCTNGKFIDIGTPESYRSAEDFFTCMGNKYLTGK